VLRHVVRHEARCLAADLALAAVLAVFGGAFAYALGNGVGWVRALDATLAEAAAEERERTAVLLEEIAADERGGDPGVLGGARGARHAGLPPGALAALSIGQSDLLPYYYQVSIWTNDQTFLQNGELENPLNLAVGRFDLAFVMVYLLPLLVLALGYNLLSQEREQGTLAMTLAQPIRLGTLIGGKVALRAGLVLALALGLSLLGLLAVLRVPTSGSPLPRMGLWVVGVTVYALFWFALSVAVNALGRPSAWNAMALAGAWLALVVVVPSTVNIASSLLHPLPSRVEMITAQRDASNDAVNRRSELLGRYYEDHPEMVEGLALDTANAGALAYAAQEEVNARVADVSRRYESASRAQQALVRRWRFTSPALLLQEALNDAAGTGDARFERFRGQVASFAGAWKTYFVPLVLSGQRTRPQDVALMPRFQYAEETELEVARRVAVPLAAMALFTVLVAVLAWRALARYQVAG
jgi:ABC-2 type transport system permease protein